MTLITNNNELRQIRQRGIDVESFQLLDRLDELPTGLPDGLHRISRWCIVVQLWR